MIYTIVGDSFEEWVHAKIKERNLKVQHEKGLLIEVDEEIDNAFYESTAISQVNKIFIYFLLL